MGAEAQPKQINTKAGRGGLEEESVSYMESSH